MGNGVSTDQGNFPTHGIRDVRRTVDRKQHDWSPLAEAPITNSLLVVANSYIHTSKILLNILLERLKAQMEAYISEEEAGFRQGRSTVQQILCLSLRLLAEKYRKIRKFSTVLWTSRKHLIRCGMKVCGQC